MYKYSRLPHKSGGIIPQTLSGPLKCIQNARPQPHTTLPNPSDILTLRVQPIHQLNALLIHGKHNPATHNQPRQPRQRPAPESQHPLLLEDNARTPERVTIQRAGLDALHARLDGVERLRDVDGDEPRDAAHGEGADRAQLLAGRRVALGQLLERRVGAEARRAVGGLSGGGRHEALEEAADAALARDDGDGVEEAAQAGIGGFAVVDSGGRG